MWAGWEPAVNVKADNLVQRYEVELEKKRRYLDGAIDEAEAKDMDDGSTRLDAEAYNRNDGETLKK